MWHASKLRLSELRVNQNDLGESSWLPGESRSSSDAGCTWEGKKKKKNCESHGSFSRNLQVSAGTQAQLPAFSLVESQASPSPRVLQAFYWLIKYRILLFSHSQVRCAVRTESLMRTGIADTRASLAPRSPASLFPPASHRLYYHHRMHGNERERLCS